MSQWTSLKEVLNKACSLGRSRVITSERLELQEGKVSRESSEMWVNINKNCLYKTTVVIIEGFKKQTLTLNYMTTSICKLGRRLS